MRRRRSADEVLPRWLVDPSPADWPDPGCHWECRYWEASEVWHREHPDLSAPPGSGPPGPFHLELI